MLHLVKKWLLLTVVMLGSTCRIHDLLDGVYTLQLTEVLRDDCAMANAPGVIGTATLKTNGHNVLLDYSFLQTRLLGTYLSQTEKMTADGTAVNVSTTVRARQCLLDTVVVHLDGETESPTRMSGAMSIQFDTRSPDECVCKLWFKFDATRTGDAPRE